MKKVLAAFLLCMICNLAIRAQQQQSVITLKNGTQVTGVVTAINPLESVTVEIGGISTTIPMSEVSKIEKLDRPSGGQSSSVPAEQDPFKNPSLITSNDKDKLRVLDWAEYPESFELNIDGEIVKMVLVRGGKLYMGYDGQGSTRILAEPMHNVLVTSFYISMGTVTNGLYTCLSGVQTQEKDKECKLTNQDMKSFMETLSQKVGFLCRMPTEAEWEYAAFSELSARLFNKPASFWGHLEHCSDLYGAYKEGPVTIDPQGAWPTSKTEKYTVVRLGSLMKGSGPWWKEHWNVVRFAHKRKQTAESRIVVKAKDYMEYLNKK